MRKIYRGKISATIVTHISVGWYVSKSLEYHSSFGVACSTQAIVVPDEGHLTDPADFAGTDEKEEPDERSQERVDSGPKRREGHGRDARGVDAG